MKVELLDCTGFSSLNPARYAAEVLIYAKSTRLQQGEALREKITKMESKKIDEELQYIANTIRSSWEFVDYTFQFTGVTRAFTHQLVRTRTGSYAQQTMRMVDMKGFEVEKPKSIEGDKLANEVWDDVIAKIQLGYKTLRGLGIPAEDARGVLPTNIHTNIIAKFNLRTLADLCGKRESLRAQGEIADAAQKMKRCVISIHPWTRHFLDPERTATPALDKLLKEDVLAGRAIFEVPGLPDALKELEKLKATWG